MHLGIDAGGEAGRHYAVNWTCYQRRRDRGTKVLEHLVDTVLYFEEIALPVTAYCAQSKIAGITKSVCLK